MYNWDEFGIDRNSDVDDQLISRLEKAFNISFPESYLDLVRFNSEASPEVCVFSYQDGETCISEFFKFSEQVEPYTISWYLKKGIEGMPEGIVPIARDAGDYLICLDFSEPIVGVKLFNPNDSKIYHIANNFDEFLESLSE